MKRFLCVLLVLAALAALSACGQRVKSEAYPEPAPAYSYDYREAAVEAEEYGGLSAAYAVSNSAAGYSEKAAGAGSPSGNAKDAETDINPEKIIYSGTATLETTKFDETIEALEAMIETYGGWVESSSVTGANYSTVASGSRTSRTADYTIRVPNDKFNSVMETLPTLGNVPSSKVYTENVTSQYYDTQARLSTYEAQEKRLIELLDMADTVSDVIEIENELTEVRYRIESLQTTLRGWDRRVSWSTVTLKVKEVYEYTPAERKGYGRRLAEAFADGIDSLGEIFIDFIEALPVLLFIGVIIFFVIRLIVRAVRKNPERAEKRRLKKEARKAAKSGEKENGNN